MNMDTTDSNLGMGISFSMSAPFAWRLSDTGITVHQRAENEKLLRIILALDEYPAEHADELAALDFKVNIVMELLAELLTHHLDLPDSVNLRLGASQLMWASDGDLPAEGEHIELSIYLHRTFPRPLILAGVVSYSEAGSCHIQLDPLPDTLQDMFEKFIFAHHRREVANSRVSQS